MSRRRLVTKPAGDVTRQFFNLASSAVYSAVKRKAVAIAGLPADVTKTRARQKRAAKQGKNI